MKAAFAFCYMLPRLAATAQATRLQGLYVYEGTEFRFLGKDSFYYKSCYYTYVTHCTLGKGTYTLQGDSLVLRFEDRNPRIPDPPRIQPSVDTSGIDTCAVRLHIEVLGLNGLPIEHAGAYIGTYPPKSKEPKPFLQVQKVTMQDWVLEPSVLPLQIAAIRSDAIMETVQITAPGSYKIRLYLKTIPFNREIASGEVKVYEVKRATAKDLALRLAEAGYPLQTYKKAAGQ